MAIQSNQPFYKYYERSLVIYAVALGIIITLIAASFLVEKKILSSQEKFAIIINMSGRQRMLSQRLAVHSLQSLRIKTDTEMIMLQSKIKKDLNDLRQTYLQLNEEGKTELNTEKTKNLNQTYRDQVNAFFNSVDVLTTPAAFSSQFRLQMANVIYPQATTEILRYFEQMTQAREVRANEIINEYLNIKFILFVATVSLILIEGVFIFYPLARTNFKNAEKILLLHQEESRLKRLSEIGEAFSRAMHEINNPLTVINVKSKQMLNRDELRPESKKSVEQICNNVDRIMKIIKSTKAIYRKGDNDPEVIVNLKKVLLDAMDSSRMIREINDIQFQIKNLDDALIKGQEHQVFQVFLNLITNAIDSLNETDLEQKEIFLEVKKEKAESLVRISDSGPGISPDKENLVFQGYYTTKTHGTGMGLSESKRLVELQNGTIHINHNISDSCFEIHYPSA